MFDAVAARYDVTNDVLSAGQSRLWRRAVVAAVDAKPEDNVLDIAAGTGTSSLPFSRLGARVVSADFSLGMMREGRRRHPQLPFVAADATRLPFADASFTAVTMSFGLRNVVDVPAALREFARVTRPGGCLVLCEFSHPPNRLLHRAYLGYLGFGLPRIAGLVSSDPQAYAYLAESIQAWPTQRELAQQIGESGWDQVEWRNLSVGIAAIHRARRR